MARTLEPPTGFMKDEDIYEFFKELWFIINDKEEKYSHVVRWTKGGNAFRIVKPEEFYKEICPMICKSCTREYFEYVMYSCDFEVVPSEFLEFRNRNSYFVQHMSEILKNIKPKKPVQSLRVFLKLSKMPTAEKYFDRQVSSTSGDDFLQAVVSSKLKNTDEGSIKKSCSLKEVSASKYTDGYMKCQVSSTSGEYSISDGATSELINTEENSCDSSIYSCDTISSTSTSLDVGACASIELFEKPSKEHLTFPNERTSYSKDEMNQEDIYSFFKELWNIISNNEYQYYSVVRWIKSGRLFRILDMTKFDEEVIPKLCESCTSDYFEYLLFACGFESIPPNFSEFYHKDFLGDDFKRLEEIKPKTSVMTPKAFFKWSSEDLQRNQNNPRISSVKAIDKISTNSLSSEEEPDTTDLESNKPLPEKPMVYIDLLAEAAKSTKTASNTLIDCASLNVAQKTVDDSPISSLSSPEDFEPFKN